MRKKYKENKNEQNKLYELFDSKMEDSLKTIQEEAKDKRPVVTGKLTEYIYTHYDDNKKEVYIYNTLEYSKYVNLGTIKQNAQPYLEQGLYCSDVQNNWK